MTKPVLRLGFIDYFDPIPEFFTETLSNVFDIIRDDDNPDYVIFCDETFGTENAKFNSRNVKKIFYTGENRRPWNYMAHHAITFDHLDGPKFYRLPLYVVDNWVNIRKLALPDIRNVRRNIVTEYEGFCSFIASNPNCKERNDFFHKLSKYKKVDSGGTLFNNIGGPLARETWTGGHTAKYDFIRKRKFHICYENSSYPGYVTEKLLHAFSVPGVIPIYWGSPTVELDFNKGSFLSRHNHTSDEDFIEKIIRVDSDDSLFYEMLDKRPADYSNKFLNIDPFNQWFTENVYVGEINKK